MWVNEPIQRAPRQLRHGDGKSDPSATSAAHRRQGAGGGGGRADTWLAALFTGP